MKHHEALIADWLDGQGHTVRHMGNGEDPPDLVVDGNIAVEVTTIASLAFQALWDLMDGVCRSLGSAERGRGYFISVRSEDRSLLQGHDRRKIAAIKRDVRQSAKCALRNHYANPDAGMYGPELAVDFIPHFCRVGLPHGVELSIIARTAENPDNVKYEVASGGTEAVWLVSHLIKTVQAAISKKTNNKLIRLRAEEYKEWWLVVTDVQFAATLTNSEAQTIADAIHHNEPWRRVLLAYIWGDKVNRVFELTADREL